MPVGIAYMLSYGGGLVGGDRIELEVDVGEGAALMLLTQVRPTGITLADNLSELPIWLKLINRDRRKCSKPALDPLKAHWA